MNRSTFAALAALVLAGPLQSGAASSNPPKAQPRESVCYKAPDLNDVCVRFTGIKTERYPNGLRAVVAPFVMRAPNGEHVVGAISLR